MERGKTRSDYNKVILKLKTVTNYLSQFFQFIHKKLAKFAQILLTKAKIWIIIELELFLFVKESENDKTKRAHHQYFKAIRPPLDG